MESTRPYRPRLSRETRLLLTAGVLAIVALWVLARIRFQELPVTPNPVPAVLSQLSNGPKYDDLSAEITRLQTRLGASLLALPAPETIGALQHSPTVAALRFRDDAAIAWLPPSSPRRTDLLARDPASGLAVVKLSSQPSTSPPINWIPRRLDEPRYVAASEISGHGVSMRPAFIGALAAVDNALWSDAVWAVPANSELALGSFLFTNSAELVGLVIENGGERVIVPGSLLLEVADELIRQPQPPSGALGVDVQMLTEPVSSATGASTGVVVTWVEPGGPADRLLKLGDVIEALQGRPITTLQDWNVPIARLAADQKLNLRVRHQRKIRDVTLVAVGTANSPLSRPLGLTLGNRTRAGSEIVRVERASAGAYAGLMAGDLIVLAGDIEQPTSAQVNRAFGSLRPGQHLLVAVRRGTTQLVTAVQR